MASLNPISPIERTLRQRLLASFRRSCPVRPARILVGFSGGNDSLALALLLKGIGPAIETPIELVHVDHRMRPGSSQDAEQAERLAAALGLPITVLTSEATPQSLHPGVGPEEAARRVRYGMFAATAQPGDVLALAHHAGDQAETVLLHLLRGTGIEGLRGMAEFGSIATPWWDSPAAAVDLVVLRPLLGETKADLSAVVVQSGLIPIEDESNADETFRRNAVRHRLMPLLTDLEPTIERRLGDLARIASTEDDLLDSMTSEVMASIDDEPGLPRRLVMDSHPAISRRLVRRWVKEQVGLDLTLDRVEAIRELAASSNGAARIEIGQGFIASINREHLLFQPPESD